MKRFFAFLSVACLAVSIQAGTITQLTTLGDLNGNDVINWTQLGSSGTTVSSPANVVTSLGYSASVSNGNTLERLDQGDWGGNFSNGDPLLWNNGAGSIEIDFAYPLVGFAFQIQADLYGAFQGSVDIFNGNTLLTTLTVAGNSNGNADNSAVVLGALDTDSEITKIVVSVSDINGGNDFAINDVQLASVPEPATFGLFGAAFAALLIAKRRASKAA